MSRITSNLINHPFTRVLRLAMRRRWSIAGIIATSLLVAMLWGTNISALYPMVEIVFRGDTIKSYTDGELSKADQQLDELDRQARFHIEAPAEAQPIDETNRKLALREIETRRTLIEKGVKWLRWAKPTIDRFSPSTPYSTLAWIVGILILGTGIKLVALGANLMLVQYVSDHTLLELRHLYFRKALRLDLDSFGENGSADLTSRLTNDTGAASAGIAVLLGRLIREPLKMAVCLGGALSICPRLLLLVAVLAPIMGLVSSHLSRAIRRSNRKAMEEMSQMYGMLTDAFSGIRVVKAFNTQARERAKFSRGTRLFFDRSMKIALYSTLARSSSELIGMTMVCLAILGGGYLVVNQETHLLGLRMTYEPINVGRMLLFFGFLIGASDPARKLQDVWANLQRGIAAAERVYAVIDMPVRVTEPAEPKTVARPHREITFDNVTYQYASGPRVLNGINLSVRHGETIAVVGPNGSGKSTLVSLLCRFDDPHGGTVAIDGLALNEMATRDLRRRIALVTQRTILFDDTIENNIRYGSPGADSHAVVRAAKMAYADEFILHKTPEGYKTLLGTGGMRLSGGQMQRLALARAFLRDPDILILDEATSAIDYESEQLIHQALAKFLINRTGIMITHRPTSLAMADRVVVIESGQIADQGTHQQLILRNRFYQSLCGNDHKKKAA
jgi:ATP-binding cassette, subfamily B, bacterial MsbA